MTKKYQNRQRAYSKIVGLFLLLTVVAIFVIMHFALAKVTIKIYSQVEQKDYSGLIELLPENSLDFNDGNIFGRLMNKELELTASVSSEETAIQSDKAGGYVTIINNYSKNQALVATTRLLTPDNKLYRLQDKVNVPAGGQVEVWAEADQSGEEFAIEQTSMIIPGLWAGLQDKIYATTEGMQLTSLPIYQVTAETLKTAQTELDKQAIDQGLAAINELLSKNLQIDQSRIYLERQTIESSQIGETSTKTTLTQKIKVYGLVFDQETLLTISHDKFTKESPAGEKIFEFLDDTFNYQIIEIYPDRQQAVIEVNVSANTSSDQHMIDLDKDQLVGQTGEGINNYLSQFKIDKAEIDFFPFWVNKVPKFKDHIIIE
jgi:hypothetical protein